HPQDIVISPDGTKAYVSEMGASETDESTIAEVDVASGKILRRLDLQGNHQPHLLQLSRDGKRLWAACAPQQAIVEIAIDEPGQVKAWKTGQAGSYMVVVMPDEKKIYAANFDAGTITSIDHASGALRQLPFAGKPIGIDASPDGREVWISNLEKNTIAILDPKTDQILETISSEGNGPV